MKVTDKRGAALAQAVAEYITEHPEEWDQGTWGCGTRACLGGRALIMTGLAEIRPYEGTGVEVLELVGPQPLGTSSSVAGKLLELDSDAAYSLFYDPWELDEDEEGSVDLDTPIEIRVQRMWQKLTELYGSDKITTPEAYR